MKNHLIKVLLVLNSSEKRQWRFLILFSLLISIVDIVSIALLLFIISFYSIKANYPDLSWLPDWLLNQHSLWLIGLFLIFFIIKNIAAYYLQAAQYKFVYRVALRISGARLLSYLEGSYSNFVKIDSSVHIRFVSQQPIEFAQYVLAGTQLIITESILISMAVAAIVLYNAKVFLLLSLILLPAVVLLAWITRKRLKSVRIHVKESGEKALQHLKEALSGFIEANIYGKHDFFLKRFSNYQGTLNEYLSDLQVAQGISSRMIEVVAVLGLFIMIAINDVGNYQSDSLIGIGAFMAAAYKIIPGIVKIFNASGQVKAYSFTTNELTVDKKAKEKSGWINSESQIRSVRVEELSFSHDHKILDHFNMQITRGEMVGIEGSSGIGKTTLVNILLGFLKPDSGNIIINDVMITDARRLSTYWPAISYVKQQPFLIYDTIIKNIMLNENDDNKHRLLKVVETCGLQFVQGGIEKIISENGKNISGGQRQRIAIARALYKNADFFILDEPFNELDKESEAQLLKHFRDLSRQGKMVMLITHNKDSLAFCDRVISLNYAKV